MPPLKPYIIHWRILWLLVLLALGTGYQTAYGDLNPAHLDLQRALLEFISGLTAYLIYHVSALNTHNEVVAIRSSLDDRPTQRVPTI